MSFGTGFGIHVGAEVDDEINSRINLVLEPSKARWRRSRDGPPVPGTTWRRAGFAPGAGSGAEEV